MRQPYSLQSFLPFWNDSCYFAIKLCLYLQKFSTVNLQSCNSDLQNFEFALILLISWVDSYSTDWTGAELSHPQSRRGLFVRTCNKLNNISIFMINIILGQDSTLFVLWITVCTVQYLLYVLVHGMSRGTVQYMN